MIAIGAQVPAFELKDQNGMAMASSELRGRLALLSFHPLAWTGVCQRQMEALEMTASVFDDLNTLALGISVDSVPCKKAWAESINVKTTPLLADFWPHGGLAQSLDIFRDADGISERANVIVDKHGVVQWIKVYPIGDLPDLEELLHVLRNLNS